MTESDLAVLLRLVDELNESTGELADRSAEQTQAQNELREELASVEAKLPGFVPKRRFAWAVGGALVVVVLIALAVGWNRADAQSDQHDARLASVARSYGNCEGINRAFHGVDIGYTYLAALSYANAAGDEERLERIKLAHDALRAGLNRTDCSGHLEGLSEEDVQRVIGEASRTQPTLPLPTPPTLAPR